MFLLGIGVAPLSIALLVYFFVILTHATLGRLGNAFLFDAVLGALFFLAGMGILRSLQRIPLRSLDSMQHEVPRLSFGPVVAVLGGVFLGIVILAMSFTGPALNQRIREVLLLVLGILFIVSTGAWIRFNTLIGRRHRCIVLLITVVAAIAFLVWAGILPLHPGLR
ncbi:MAG: hypothetical protein M0Z41_11105 [Peptococcaceae bacterium]|nr:hypothetical protein [Peptococcaceae bacterium]